MVNRLTCISLPLAALRNKILPLWSIRLPSGRRVT
jgi:hypothetical protein